VKGDGKVKEKVLKVKAEVNNILHFTLNMIPKNEDDINNEMINTINEITINIKESDSFNLNVVNEYNNSDDERKMMSF
jgi:hypothetical protein